MPLIALSPQQRQALKPYAQSFAIYIQSDAFAENKTDRVHRELYYQKELPKRVDKLTEAELDELISSLWASRMWGNKQYLVQKVIADNSIEKLRIELKSLLDTATPYQVRYEHFLKEVKGLGPASLTEMLCYIQPQECGIWNQKARQAIKILGMESLVNPAKYRLSAREYENFNQLLKSIAAELPQVDSKTLDLLFVDYFLFQVTEQTPESAVEADKEFVFDHDEMCELIENIGAMLGFDTSTEEQIGRGAKVDVIWRSRIGNLGLVTYVFEVHKNGSMDSLLLNLQKAKSSPTVQKVIAVSDQVQLDKIKGESEGLPEEFRRSLGFWRVEDVKQVGDHLQSAMGIISSLNLVQGNFGSK